MAEPTGSNFPGSLDDDSTLFGDPTNQVDLTLNTNITDVATTMIVNEAIDDIEVPVYLHFDSGEIVYAEAKNDGAKTFSVMTRGAGGTANVSHDQPEAIYAVIAAEYYIQAKEAIVAIETALGAGLANVVEETDHTKAAHDAMDIDADTLDTISSTGFMLAGEPVAGDQGELTINSGEITVTSAGFYDVDTQADASSDDLDTILGGTNGDIVILRAENAVRTVIVKHNTGNIQLQMSYDIPLVDQNQLLVLRYDGTDWWELSGGADRIGFFGAVFGTGELLIPNGTLMDIPFVPHCYLLAIYAMATASGSVSIDIRTETFGTIPDSTDSIGTSPCFSMSSEQTKSDTALSGITPEQPSGCWRFINTAQSTTIKQISILCVVVKL